MAEETRNEFLRKIMKAPPAEFGMILYKSAENYAQTQEQTLLDILAHAKNSEYGKKFHFDRIENAGDFRRYVPITEYSDYLPYIERMKKGEEDVLFDGKTSSFARSSATTGKAKYIPDSSTGELVKKIVMGIRSMEMLRCCPAALTADGKMMAITNLSVFEKTEGGIPVGSASGQAAESDPEAAKRVAIPAAMRSATELKVEDVDYLTALFGFAERNVLMLGCNNVAHFNILVKLFNDRFADFIRDIRRGTISVDMSDGLRDKLMKDWKPNPERAGELEQIRSEKGTLTTGDIWNNFKFVCCWLSAGVGRIAKEMKNIFPENTVFFDWGYGASEGKFNVPVSTDFSGGPVVPFGYFYEFLPLGKKETVLLDETEDGGRYEFVLTSYSGFYRYNIHDIVEIRVDSDGVRNMEFICKSSDSISLGQSTLYSADLTDIVERYEAKNKTMLRIFQGKEKDGKLMLYVEPVDQGMDKNGFELFLEDELKKFGIALVGIEWKEDGYRDSLFIKRLHDGSSVNQTKLPVFI